MQSSFNEGLKLFEHLLKDPKADNEALTGLVSNILKEREDNKKDKNVIQRRAMVNYAKYGPKNPFSNILKAEELSDMAATKLTDRIKELTTYNHQIFYYGPSKPEEIISILEQEHKLPKKMKEYPANNTFNELEMTENKVLFVDYDMVQTELLMLSKGQNFNKEIVPYASIFNEYFGAGLSSIVFQEIREAKALAYSAYCFYTTPSKAEDAHYVQAYIGTQTDKLSDAVAALLDLMNNMPEAEGQFNDSKNAALKKIETDRITKASIFWNYYSAQKRGLDYDLRKDIYKTVKGMEMEQLKGFFNGNIKGKNYTFLVIGKKDEVDFEALKKLGPVQELTLEEIFGY